MKSPSKRCPINGCKRLHHPDYLMCVFHWRMVAGPLQRAVWREYQAQRGSPAHLAACRAAVRSAEEMARVLPTPR